MLPTRRPDALWQVKLANLWLFASEKMSKLLVFLFYYLYDVIIPTLFQVSAR
jgi:hypothetical protein